MHPIGYTRISDFTKRNIYTVRSHHYLRLSPFFPYPPLNMLLASRCQAKKKVYNQVATEQLFAAVKIGDLKLVKLALENHADPNALEKEKSSGKSWSPLDWANDSTLQVAKERLSSGLLPAETDFHRVFSQWNIALSIARGLGVPEDMIDYFKGYASDYGKEALLKDIDRRIQDLPQIEQSLRSAGARD